MHKFPALVDPDQPGQDADPFVVAMAVVESKTLLAGQSPVVVVTEEKFTPEGMPRIPHVCAAYGIRYLSVHQMFVHEGWTL